MERIFWAECPGCGGKFYCNYGEMRHSSVALECPFCEKKFLPELAKSLDERNSEPSK